MKSNIFVKLGLTKNEAKLYLAILKLGESKVNSIIKEANFKSGKVYQVLDSLVEKGIISYVIKNNIKHFYPQDPEKFLDLLKKEKQELIHKESLFKKDLPYLKDLFKEKSHSCNISVYEGNKGIKSAVHKFIDNLEKNSIIRIFGANDSDKRKIILQWKKFEQICDKKNSKRKTIMCSISNEGRKQRKKKFDFKKYRYMQGKDISNFMVSKKNLLLFNWKQPNCIFIENKDHAKQFIELFKILWNNAEKL